MLTNIQKIVTKNQKIISAINISNDYTAWVKIGKALVAEQQKFDCMLKESKTG